MAAVLIAGETGKTLRMSSGGFDMSSNTSLTLEITDPAGAVTSKTATLGGTAETFDGIGAVNANEWASYTFDTGDLAAAGDYQARLIYADTGTSPVSSFKSAQATFTVSS